MIRYINSRILMAQEQEIVSAVNRQNSQLRNEDVDENFLRYMLERLETDLEFFEIVQLKAENDEAKSFFGSIAILGRIVRDIVRRRFFRLIV